MTQTIFVFPGQGSQKSGMGKSLADNFSVAREVFQEVDDTLNQKLSALMFDGSESELAMTENTQPAIMAVSIAALRVLEKETNINIEKGADYVAGHSLGEYTALCAAKAFSLADTAKLLRARGKAMQEAVSPGDGMMAAIIGLEIDKIDRITEKASEHGVCEIANDNSDGQIVISGHEKAIKIAMDLAGEAGAKRAIALNVSAPFHSSLMEPASDVMKEELDNTDIKTPFVPVIANVTALPVQEKDQIKDLLIQQITGRVRWRESVEWMQKHGVTEAIEIGEGKVLSGLIRRIAKEISVSNIGSSSDIDVILKAA